METPRKFITASNKFTWCFHKQNYYMFYRHANIQRTHNNTIIYTIKLLVMETHNTIIYPVCLYNVFLQRTVKSYISC